MRLLVVRGDLSQGCNAISDIANQIIPVAIDLFEDIGCAVKQAHGSGTDSGLFVGHCSDIAAVRSRDNRGLSKAPLVNHRFKGSQPLLDFGQGLSRC